MKKCPMCERTLELSEYYFNRKRNGYQSLCRECHRLDSNRRLYDKKHGDGTYEAFYIAKRREQQIRLSGSKTCVVCTVTKPADHFYVSQVKCKRCVRRRNQMKRYGILSDGPCDICGRAAQHVDHCHATQTVRGRLCSHCNLGIGQFRDNPDLLCAAAQYLNRSIGVVL